MSITTTDPRQSMRDVAAALAGGPLAEQLRHLADATPTGTMRSFMTEVDGRAVTTIQVDQRNGSVWAPTGRPVDATSRAGGVFLDRSFREYRGMRVIARTANALLVADDWHTIAYVLDTEPSHQ